MLGFNISKDSDDVAESDAGGTGGDEEKKEGLISKTSGAVTSSVKVFRNSLRNSKNVMILSLSIDFIIFFTTIAKLVSVIVGARQVYDG